MESLRVFYSWQSDSPKKENHFFIRDALRTAIEKVNGNADTDLDLRLDSDTKDVPGSPDIVQTIFSKIDMCNIFVADISIINPDAQGYRKSPNPNVLFELGYAVHRLGWERIICVFNENSGVLADLPFDLRHQRIAKYKYSSGDQRKPQDEQKKLENTFVEALRLIINSELSLPITSLTEQQKIKRTRDICNLKELLFCVDIFAFDRLFETAPDGYVHDALDYYWLNFDAKIRSSNFYFYDSHLLSLIKNFYIPWRILSTSFQHNFSTQLLYERAIFEVKDKRSELEFKRFIKVVTNLQENLLKFLEYIKENYLDIDVSVTSDIARKNYLNVQKSFVNDNGGE